MPGPTPLTATHRMELNMLCAGLNHQMRFLCHAVLVGGTWELENNGGYTNPTFDGAVDQVLNLFAQIYDAGEMTFGPATLAHYVSGAYFPIHTYNSSVVPVATGNVAPASQITYVFNSTLFEKIKIVAMETNEVAPQHQTAIAGLSADEAAIVNSVIAPTSDVDLGNWMRSRGNEAPDGFVGFTVSLNKRVRRDRGLV